MGSSLVSAMSGPPPGPIARTLSEEDAYRDLFARDPVLAGQARGFGATPTMATPEENSRAVLGMLPVSGNVISAQDAYNSFGDLRAASKAGDVREQRKAMAQTLLGALGAFSPVPFGSMAGRAAEGAASRANIFAGPMAKTADHEALARAQDMAGSGAHPEDIWRDTGWLQGPDGKWRFEIGDTGANVSFGSGAGLSGPLQHSDVAAAYPGLSDMKTSVLPDAPGDWTSYYVRRGEGGPELRARGRDPDDRRLPARSTAIHELQHAVDDQEGRLTGYGPYKSPAEAYGAMPEVAAREAQWRMDMTDAERRAKFPERLMGGR